MSVWPELTAREEGGLVEVEPLAAEHEEGLFVADQDPRRLAVPDRVSLWG